MTENQKQGLQYRFSGYPPPLIQLDATGPGYWIQWYTHPYYSNQPQVWSQSSFMSGGVAAPAYSNVKNQKQDDNLFQLLPVCKK